MPSAKPEPTTPSPARRSPFRWLRFSLRELLLAVVILSLFVPLLDVTRRLRQSDTQLESLRNEIGYLSVGDPDLLHAIAVPSYEHLTFRWRIHLPPKRSFVVSTVQDQITQEGIPSDRDDRLTVWEIKPSDVEREVILTFAVRRGHEGNWGYAVTASDSNTTRYYSLNGASWLDRVNNIGTSQTGTRNTVPETLKEGLPLLRVNRITKTPTGGYIDIGTPRDGVLLWISKQGQ